MAKSRGFLLDSNRKAIISMADSDTVLKPILTVLMLTGIRPGELLALKWKDLDTQKSTLSIRQAVSREVEFNDNGGTHRKDVLSNTKTVLSVRSFKVPQSVVAVLDEWKGSQVEKQLKKGIDFTSPNCHIFSTKDGQMRTYAGLRSSFRRFLSKNNLDGQGINLYSFRHTFATILLEEKVNPKIVAELMGHSKVETTLRVYSHVIASSIFDSTANTLESAYQGITT